MARAFGDSADETRAFVDSIASGGLAADLGIPILLTDTQDLAASVEEYLAGLNGPLYVVGGEAAVSSQVFDAANSIAGVDAFRVAGSERAATASAVAQTRGFNTSLAAGQPEPPRIVLVDARSRSDAWVGGFAGAAYSARFAAPIMLTYPDVVPDATRVVLEDGTEPVTVSCLPPLTTAGCNMAARAGQGPPPRELDFRSEPLSLVYPPVDLTDSTAADWQGVRSGSGCSFPDPPPIEPVPGQILVEQTFSAATCVMGIEVGTPSELLRQRYYTLSDDLPDQESETVPTLSGGMVVRNETISIFEEPLRWFPCHGTGGDPDSMQCQMFLNIKPVNTVVARMTYASSTDCANGSLGTGSRDSVGLTVWEYGPSGFDAIFDCNQATTAYFQSFRNDVFCEAVIRFSQGLDADIDSMSIGGLDAIDTESPTLTSVVSIAAGRPNGGTYNTSIPTVEGGCQHFRGY